MARKPFRCICRPPRGPMKRPFRLFESRRTPSAFPAITGNGFLVTTLTGLLMMLFGSAALISAALSWQTAASRAGVAGQARAAAERGFHAVIDLLNDPANGHLLVTKWDELTSNWVPVSNADLAACQITSKPSDAVARSAILTAPQTVGGLQVRYTLTGFVPPVYPSGAAPASLPAVCRASFGNLQGGTAGFTIRGEVLQGEAVLARYELQRYTTVNSFRDTTPGNPPVSGPLAFLGTGGGGSTAISVEKDPSILTRIARDGGSTPWRWDSNDEKLTTTCLGNTEAQCRSGSSTLDSQFPVAGYSLADYASIYPPSPPYSTQMNAVTAADVTTTSCYPYTICGGTILRSNCIAVSLPTQAGENQGVIACKIGEIKLDEGDLRVDTSGRPVVFYLMKDTPIDIKKGQIINSYFAANRATDPTSWSRLRLFGNPEASFSFPLTTSATVGNCSNGSTQTWKIEAGSARINGAFIWAPKANIEFKESSGIALTEYSMFGAVWACKTKFEKKVRFLTNGSSDQIGIGIDQVFGLGVQFRYVAQGVERSQ